MKMSSSPKEIVYEDLCDFVVCELCGGKFKCITNTHLKSKHDTDVKTYKEHFPSAEITNEKQRYDISLRSKESWLDPALREIMIKNQKITLSDPKIRQFRSDYAKERWNQPDSIYRTEEHRRIQSEAITLLHKDPKFKVKHKRAIKRALKDPLRREKMSIAKEKNWADPNHVYNSPEYREKISKANSKKKN